MPAMIDVMAKKKPNDRHQHKPLNLRLHSVLRMQLEKLCERNVSTLTAEVTIAIRQHLAANGLWPPETPPR